MPKYSLPRNIWRAIYPIIIFFGISIVIIVVAVIAYSVGFAFDAASSGEMPLQSAIEDQTNAFLAEQGMTTQLIAGIAGVIVFSLMWRKIRTGLREYENNKLSLKLIALMLIFGATLNLVLSFVFAISEITRFFPEYEGVAEMLMSGSFIVRFLALGIAAPIVEELCCRGIVFNRLASWMPSWVAVIVSSAVFGAMHLNVFQGLYAFVLGVVFCVLYIRYRNLWIPIIGHLAFNAANIVLVEIISITGEEEINALLLIIPSVLLTAGCIAAMVKHTKAAVPVPQPEMGEEESGTAIYDYGN